MISLISDAVVVEEAVNMGFSEKMHVPQGIDLRAKRPQPFLLVMPSSNQAVDKPSCGGNVLSRHCK